MVPLWLYCVLCSPDLNLRQMPNIHQEIIRSWALLALNTEETHKRKILMCSSWLVNIHIYNTKFSIMIISSCITNQNAKSQYDQISSMWHHNLYRWFTHCNVTFVWKVNSPSNYLYMTHIERQTEINIFTFRPRLSMWSNGLFFLVALTVGICAD